MIDWLRESLYLPLGFLPSVFFVSRWGIQWYHSEKRQISYAGPHFWKLSLLGNLLFILHYIVQVQYHFTLFQTVNAVISWRNLNLIYSHKAYSKKSVVFIIISSIVLITAIFLAQSYLLIGEIDWVRSPKSPFTTLRQHHSIVWHVVGTAGAIVFASRFWVQWWLAERNKKSELNAIFWYLSIVGSCLTTVYSLHIGDIVSLLHNSFAVVPCLRNLFFIKKSPEALKQDMA